MSSFLQRDRLRFADGEDHPPSGPTAFDAIPPFGSSPTSAVSASSNPSLNSLLRGIKWGDQAAVELTVSFPGAGATWATGYGEPLNGFRPLSGQQQAAVRSALDRLSEVANISFREVADTAADVGTIRFGVSSLPATAWAYYPSAAPNGGDVWLGTFYHGGNPSYAEGTYYYHTMLHELGHALGLKHPHDSGGVSGALPAVADWLGASMMSYRSYLGDTTEGGYSNAFYPTTAMPLDVLALQHMYGANHATRSGDTVYRWAPGERLFETIWDGGGTDTVDWSSQSTAAVIRLEAGAWSELGPAYTWSDGAAGSFPGTVAIAYGAVIENARGGALGDKLYGNAAANGLFGLAGGDEIAGLGGDDLIEPGTGNDLVDGGAGVDKVSYYNDPGTLGVVVDLATDSALRGTERDRLASVESLDGTRNADTINGDDLANALGGADGNDTVRGKGGGDELRGGTGNDLIEPGLGDDAVYGGPGSDKVSYFPDPGVAGIGIDLSTGTATRGGETDRLIEVENADGTNNADTMIGSAAANLLGGAGGNDVLLGREGNDALLGAVGNDRLAGGAGRDTLTGGLGTDLFDFDTVGESPWSTGRNSCDVVTDFARGDRLDFSTIDARPTTAQNDAFTFLAQGGAGFTAAGQIRWYQSNGSTFVEASNDADATGELQVQLAGLKTLTATDFIV